MNKVDERREELVVYLPDTRGVEISRFGKGNLKIGPNVYTYSRLPGNGIIWGRGNLMRGTCPGSSEECEAICYAKHVEGPVWDLWARNSLNDDLPAELPPGCQILRIHISGDFTSVAYIENWIALLTRNPHVTTWAYTRSWRVPDLLPKLERLRALPNVQLFASMDKSVTELPPDGWRRAWIEGDPRLVQVTEFNQVVKDGFSTPSFMCPEQDGRKMTCEACGYCQDGRQNDVTFLEH